MTYRLVASDLDGTLLNKKAEISIENWKAIETMNEKGVFFVPSSGRCFMELPREIRESDLIRYYILSGGAVVYDKVEDNMEMTCPTKEEKDRVLDLIFRYPACLFAHTGRESVVDTDRHNAASYQSYNMNPYWVSYALEKETPIENFKQFVYEIEKISMLVVFFRNIEDLNECKRILAEEKDLLVVQSDPFNLEIVSAKAGKGNALLHLAKSLGIRREETIAIGDSQNDRTMLQEAGLGLAMANAIPELQAIADKVICDNDSHCIDYVLENYLL